MSLELQSLEIHQAVPADVEVVHRILEDGRLLKIALGDTSWGEDPFELKEAADIVGAGHTYIANLEGQAVGTMGLTWDDDEIWKRVEKVQLGAGYISRRCPGR